jgi:hypothetical protein
MTESVELSCVRITYVFPPYEWPDLKVNEKWRYFAFPTAPPHTLELGSPLPAVRYHFAVITGRNIFVLTTIVLWGCPRSRRKRAFCLLRNPLRTSSLIHESMLESSACVFLGSGWKSLFLYNSKVFLLRWTWIICQAHSLLDATAQNQTSVLLQPTVLCLISHYPLLSCLRSSLERLVKASDTSVQEIEKLIAYLILEVPLPFPGQCKVMFWPNDNNFITASLP